MENIMDGLHGEIGQIVPYPVKEKEQNKGSDCVQIGFMGVRLHQGRKRKLATRVFAQVILASFKINVTMPSIYIYIYIYIMVFPKLGFVNIFLTRIEEGRRRLW